MRVALFSSKCRTNFINLPKPTTCSGNLKAKPLGGQHQSDDEIITAPLLIGSSIAGDEREEKHRLGPARLVM